MYRVHILDSAAQELANLDKSIVVALSSASTGWRKIWMTFVGRL